MDIYADAISSPSGVHNSEFYISKLSTSGLETYSTKIQNKKVGLEALKGIFV